MFRLLRVQIFSLLGQDAPTGHPTFAICDPEQFGSSHGQASWPTQVPVHSCLLTILPPDQPYPMHLHATFRCPASCKKGKKELREMPSSRYFMFFNGPPLCYGTAMLLPRTAQTNFGISRGGILPLSQQFPNIDIDNYPAHDSYNKTHL